MSRETLRLDLDNAAGEAFLPEGWQRIVKHVGPLLAVADAAAKVAAVSYPLTQASVGPRPEDNGAWSNNLRLSDMDDLRAALAAIEALP